MLGLIDALRGHEDGLTNREIFDSLKKNLPFAHCLKMTEINRTAAICASLGLIEMTDEEGNAYEAAPFYVDRLSPKEQKREQEKGYEALQAYSEARELLNKAGIEDFMRSTSQQEDAENLRVYILSPTGAGKILVEALSPIYERLSSEGGRPEPLMVHEQMVVIDGLVRFWGGDAVVFQLLPCLLPGCFDSKDMSCLSFKTKEQEAAIEHALLEYKRAGLIGPEFEELSEGWDKIHLTEAGLAFGQALIEAKAVADLGKQKTRPKTIRWTEPWHRICPPMR